MSRVCLPVSLESSRNDNDPRDPTEMSKEFFYAEILAWLATGTCLTVAFHTSYALQDPRSIKVSQLRSVTKELRTAISSASATIKYVPLEPASIHIRLFSDAGLKYLDKKGFN